MVSHNTASTHGADAHCRPRHLCDCGLAGSSASFDTSSVRPTPPSSRHARSCRTISGPPRATAAAQPAAACVHPRSLLRRCAAARAAVARPAGVAAGPTLSHGVRGAPRGIHGWRRIRMRCGADRAPSARRPLAVDLRGCAPGAPAIRRERPFGSYAPTECRFQPPHGMPPPVRPQAVVPCAALS
jgi:hypothetical protein